MSLITDACLYVHYAPKDVMDRLVEPLPFDSRGQSLREAPRGFEGGTKGMGGRVYAAGFNFVVPEDLVEHIASVLGERADAVLTVQMEGDPPEVHLFGDAVVRSRT